MKNKNLKINLSIYQKIIITLSFSLFIFFTIELLAKKDTGFIEWRAIPAANGYRVEIKTEDKVIIETNVNEHIYYVDLPKGKYEFRIAVLNFFKKPVVWSYWNPLRVIVSQVPVLDSERQELNIGEKVELAGSNFLENTKVSLTNQGVVVPVELKILSDKQLSFPTENLKIGTYDLLIENPNNKKLLKEKYLVLYPRGKFIRRKPPEKVIKKKDIEITSESMEKADITVDDSVSGKTTVTIGPKTKEKLDINLENKSNENVTVDINNRSAGKVTLNVENKSKDKLALNVNNLSKEKMSVGIIDKSKGKIEVNVTEKSKEKVDINTIFEDVEEFDVTIENKAKSNFEINIGQPPPVVIVPKRKPAKIIDRKDISVSADSLEKVEIGVDESIPGKMSVDIEPRTEEDLEISLENKSKENVSIDINNRAAGKVKLLVENKSTENLAINLNNASKENLTVAILERSIGNVDVKINEKSKNKVDISKSDAEIEYFDVTIENKTKDKFDVNIGKKEPPPLKFEKSNEKFPPNYPKYSLKEYKNFIAGLKRSCASNLDVPDILIDNCHPRHVTLNLGDMDRKVLYNFIKLESGNYISRITAYKFFIENCNPLLAFISELADYRLKNITLDENEKFYSKKTIESFNTCKNKDER
jgi:hypothetical protein